MGIGLVYPVFSSMFFHGENPVFLVGSSDAVKGFWLGMLLAMTPLAQFVSSPILGSISDQKGRKPILLLTLFLGLSGYFISAMGIWAKSLFLSLLGRFIVGIASGNAAIANSVLADLSLPLEKIKNFGFLHMAAGLGFSIGPFLGGKLSESSFLGAGGFDKPFLFAASLTLLNLALLIFLFDETLIFRAKRKIDFFSPFKRLRQIFSIKPLCYVLICIFVFRFGWSFYWEFIPVTWIEEYGLSTSQVGTFYAYSAGFYALSCGFLIRPITNRLNSLSILFAALIATGCYLFLSVLVKPEWLWLYLPFQQYFIACLFPTAATIVSNWTAQDIQGEIMGVYQSIESLAFGLSPLISGCLIGISHKMPIMLGGISMLIAAFILWTGCSKEVFAKQKGVL